MELAGQPWVRSQTLEGMERRARGLPKAVFVRALEGRLAVVADSQPVVGPVQATLATYSQFTGKIIAPPGLPETAQRPGHIPGAVNVPWSKAVNDDGTFRSLDELQALYGGKGVTDDRETIAYCRIGERSSHTWFVLKYLLGLSKVRNYDGSWTEWGNLVDAPIAKGA